MLTFVGALVTTAVAAGNFAHTPTAPIVIFAQEKELRQICDIDPVVNGTLHGCFKPATPFRVYMNAKLTGLAGASSLLHEIVHYVQYHNGQMEDGFAGLHGCKLWLMNELEAFTIQEAWLEEQGYKLSNFEATLAAYASKCD